MATIVATASGGTRNWSSTATWVGGVVPTAADDVRLNETCGNVNVDANTNVCRSLDCTNYVNTLTHVAAITLTIGDGTAGAGSIALKLVAGMTYTRGGATSTFSFVSTSATQQTIDLGGKAPGAITHNGTGSWKYTTAVTLSGAFTLTKGTIDTNSQTFSSSSFVGSGAQTRALTMGTTTWTVTGAGSTTWNGNGSGFTLSVASATIVLSGTGAQFNGGSQTWGTVNFTGAANASITGSAGLTIGTLTRTGTAAKTDEFQVLIGITVTGTLTLASNSSVNRLLVNSGTAGTTVTITAATVTCSNVVDFRDITGAGAATWTVAGTGATYLGDAGGNSGITFTASATQTRLTGGGSNWSDATRWTSRVPLPQDDVIVGAVQTSNLNGDMPRMGRNIDFTGTTCTWQLSVATTWYGSLTLGSGMAITGTGVLTPAGRGSHTLTTAGIALPTNQLIIAALGGTYALQDDVTVSGSTGVAVTDGTLDLNGHNVTGSVFNFGSGRTRSVIGTGTFVMTSTALGAFWNASQPNGSIASTVNVTLSTTSGVSRTFAGNGYSYGTLTYTVAGSTGALAITGANTFATINFSDATNARTLTLPASTTTTVTTALNVNGTAGKLMTINSSTAGTAATLNVAAIGDIVLDYVSVKDSTATVASGYKLYAGLNSTNVSGNTGWTFGVIPVGSSRQALWSVRTTVGSARQTLWAVRSAVGSARALVWSVMQPVGSERTVQWGVRVAAGSERELDWRTRAAVGTARQLLWPVRAAVGSARQMLWGTRATAGSNLALVWSVRTAVGAARALVWGIRGSAGSARQVLWSARQAVGSAREVVWSVRTTVGSERTVEWGVRQAAGSERDLRWSTLATVAVGSERSLLWGIRQAVGSDRVLSWDMTAAAGSSRTLAWDVRQAVGSDRQLVWPTAATAHSERGLRWNTRALVTSERELLWALTSAVGSVRDLEWETRATAGSSRQVLWSTRTFAGSSRSLRWRVHVTAGSGRDLLWAVRQAAGSQRALVWTASAVAGSSRAIRWDVAVVVGSSITLIWRIRGADRDITVSARAPDGWSGGWPGPHWHARAGGPGIATGAAAAPGWSGASAPAWAGAPGE